MGNESSGNQPAFIEPVGIGQLEDAADRHEIDTSSDRLRQAE